MVSTYQVYTTTGKNNKYTGILIIISLPKECAAVVLELKKRPRPRSPNFTTPVAVINTLAGFMSKKENIICEIMGIQTLTRNISRLSVANGK